MERSFIYALKSGVSMITTMHEDGLNTDDIVDVIMNFIPEILINKFDDVYFDEILELTKKDSEA